MEHASKQPEGKSRRGSHGVVCVEGWCAVGAVHDELAHVEARVDSELGRSVRVDGMPLHSSCIVRCLPGERRTPHEPPGVRCMLYGGDRVGRDPLRIDRPGYFELVHGVSHACLHEHATSAGRRVVRLDVGAEQVHELSRPARLLVKEAEVLLV